MYTPTPLSTHPASLDVDTQARLSRAEMALVRLEDRAEDCDVWAALHRVLARLEAVASIRIEGKAPDLCSVLRVESLLSFDGTDTADALAGLDALDFADEADWRTTLEVMNYQIALERIYRGDVMVDGRLTPASLLDIHALSRFGMLAARTGTHMRRHPYRARVAPDGTRAHVAPDPGDVPALIDDLCAFMSEDLYSPIGQAAIAHFQFEGIKPFKSGIARTGRLMCHAIIHRRRLARRLIAPIGLEPAIDTRSHAEALLPYRFDETRGWDAMTTGVSRWADFCAQSTEVSCVAAEEYLAAILELRDAWVSRFGRPNRGSAVAELLGLMPGCPVLGVRQSAALIGRSLSSVNEAFLRLEAAGIVASQEGLQRNRVYVAPEAVAMLKALERRMIPNGPISRDSLGL